MDFPAASVVIGTASIAAERKTSRTGAWDGTTATTTTTTTKMKLSVTSLAGLLCLLVAQSHAYQGVTLWDVWTGTNVSYPSIAFNSYVEDLSEYDFDDLTSAACVSNGLYEPGDPVCVCRFFFKGVPFVFRSRSLRCRQLVPLRRRRFQHVLVRRHGRRLRRRRSLPTSVRHHEQQGPFHFWCINGPTLEALKNAETRAGVVDPLRRSARRLPLGHPVHVQEGQLWRPRDVQPLRRAVGRVRLAAVHRRNGQFFVDHLLVSAECRRSSGDVDCCFVR